MGARVGLWGLGLVHGAMVGPWGYGWSMGLGSRRLNLIKTVFI